MFIRTIAILSFAAFGCVKIGSAQSTAEYAGVWDYTVTTPDTVMTGVLTLTNDGGTITFGEERTADVFELLADGDRIRFGIADPVTPSKVRLAVYGDIFKGRMTIFGKGSPEIRGVRRGPDGKPAFVLGAVNTNLTIRDLMANEEAKAVIEKHLPGFFARPQLEQGFDYPLRGVVNFLNLASEKQLHLIDVDLAKLGGQ